MAIVSPFDSLAAQGHGDKIDDAIVTLLAGNATLSAWASGGGGFGIDRTRDPQVLPDFATARGIVVASQFVDQDFLLGMETELEHVASIIVLFEDRRTVLASGSITERRIGELIWTVTVNDWNLGGIVDEIAGFAQVDHGAVIRRTTEDTADEVGRFIRFDVRYRYCLKVVDYTRP